MASNLDRYKNDLENLIKLGQAMATDLEIRYLASEGKLSKDQKEIAKDFENAFEQNYQKWYFGAFSVVKQLAPDRITEFETLYKGEGKRREINAVTYNIQDWLNGIRSGVNNYSGEKLYNDFACVTMRFKTQLAILEATSSRFDSALFDIRQLLQADLFDSELDAARELVKHGFLRAAGAVGGVVLEKHLAQVTKTHTITIRKQHPTIADLNDALKNVDVLDVPGWRAIQRLGDIRNLCDHNKHRDPTKEEVSELIDGVDKITKTLF